MLKIFLFNQTKIPLLEKALSAYAMRQKAIASNIANVTTIGYRRIDVKFEEELRSTIDGSVIKGYRTNEKHFPIGAKNLSEVEPEVEQRQPEFNSDELASGVNNVDIDYEMAELAKNQIRFKLASRMMAEIFKGIQKSIKGGAL